MRRRSTARSSHGAGPGIATVVVSRLLSTLLGVPVFFVDDAPSWAAAVVGIAIVLTLVGVWLVVTGSRQHRLPMARPGHA
jgi:hypothetical protein